MKQLIFNEERHEYSLAGKILPGVTSILKDSGFVESGYFSEGARHRGKMVHKTIELYELGELDEGELDDRLTPYLTGWKAFKAHLGIVPVKVETYLCSRFGFAGTPDYYGIDQKGKRILLDLKSSSAHPKWIGLQLSAYWLMLEEQKIIVDEIMSVHLFEGKFETHIWPDRKNDMLAVWRTQQIREEMKNG